MKEIDKIKRMEKFTTLESISTAIINCRKCELYKTRTNPVPGEGRSDAKIFFVGEAPGYNEDKEGKPFVGRAGKLLDTLLASVNLSREEVFIGNVLKCRPPNNRAPKKEEIEKCKDYLLAQIKIIKPQIICPLGNFALKLLVDNNLNISEVHGKIIRKNGVVFIPMYHPAACLHKNTKLMHKMMLADMKKLKYNLRRYE